jgi:putative Holliday junction resolvase
MSENNRILGVDFGKKRVGIAISDENGVLATPISILVNDKKLFENLEQILKSEKISEVVVGESLDFYGKPNEIFSDIKDFTTQLESKFGVLVHMEKEFLSSVEARRGGVVEKNKNTGAHTRMKKEKSGRVDAKAAAIILQRYLDRRNKP